MSKKRKPDKHLEEQYQRPVYDPPPRFLPPQLKAPEPPPIGTSSYDPPPPALFNEGGPA